MHDAELQERFPELDQRSRSPALFRLNGCGVGLYGRSDVDRPTGTYVKTYCLSLLWIPVLPLSAYRVADARNGWFIFGQVPLSPTLRQVRMVLGVAAALLVLSPIWMGRSTPLGHAVFGDEEIERLTHLAESGDLRTAAMGLGEIARTAKRDRRSDAREEIAGLLGYLGDATRPADAEMVFAIAADPGDDGPPVDPALWARADAFLRARPDLDPQQAASILDAVERTAPTEEEFASTRRALIETRLATRPNDTWGASELAELLLAEEDVEGCKALLEPRQALLGQFEGARILGQIYAAEGRVDDSCALLRRYVERRLPALAEAESAFDTTFENVRDRAISYLDEGLADPEWYRRYEAADEATQFAMVSEAVTEQAETDPNLQAARERLIDAAAVVPVAMDLGIGYMQRAYAAADPVAARLDFEAAERVFASIQGVASDDPEYRLALARVSFWLDRPDEGREHLAAAVDAAGRSTQILLLAGHVLKSLGRGQEARGYWIEAYEGAETLAERQDAAGSISNTPYADPDESVLWLERADQNDPVIAAMLSYRRAERALRKGDRTLAQLLFEETLTAYDKLPETASALNNSALAAAALSRLTGDAKTLEEAARRLRAALAEQPTDDVLMDNTVSTLQALAVRRSLPDDLDHQVDAGILRGLLYDDADGRDAYVGVLTADEAFQEAVRISDRALALDTRDVGKLTGKASVAYFTNDVNRLRALLTQVRNTPPDVERSQELLQQMRARTADPGMLRGALAQRREALAKCPADATPRRRIALQLALVSAAHMLVDNDLEVDLAEYTGLASAAVETLPCAATRTTLAEALKYELHVELRATQPAYEAEWRRAGKDIAVGLFLAEACWRNDALRAAVTGSQRFEQMLLLQLGRLERFPGETGLGDWALLRLAPAARAEQVTASARASERDLLHAQITGACLPYFPSTALMQAWVDRLHGNPESADTALRECRERGGNVPFLE